MIVQSAMNGASGNSQRVGEVKEGYFSVQVPSPAHEAAKQKSRENGEKPVRSIL
jgi:hypothetical protein